MNLYAQFRKLFPQKTLQVGDVVAYANGVATIQEPGGGLSQARGDVAVNDRVYFRDGVIEGPAPDLPVVELEV